MNYLIGTIWIYVLIIGMLTICVIPNKVQASTEFENEVSQDTDAIDYTLYNNPKLGISFEYPSNWTISENSNRFDIGEPDVQVSESRQTNFNPHLFKFINNNEELDQNLANGFSLEEISEKAKDSITENDDSAYVIEPVNMDKFSVDGYPTATFLITSDNDLGFAVAQQLFLIEKDNKIYTLKYDNYATEFDLPKNQEFLNHFLDSFKFTSAEENANIGNDNTKDADSDSNLENYSPVSSNGVDIQCGDFIRSDVVLDSNLYCYSDGLIVMDQDDLTIDLNGHTISGPGVDSNKVGIMLSESKNIKILGNGTIKNFQAGILNTGSQSNSISSTTLPDNEIGIFNTMASNAEIVDNNIFSNSIGIASHSSDGLKIMENNIDSNDLAGLTFVNSGESQITSNTVKNSVNGLFLDPLSTYFQINKQS